MRPNPYVTCPYGQNSPSLHVFGGRPRPLSNNKSSHSCDAGGGFPATQNTVSQAALTQYGIQTYLWEKRTLTLESKRDSITGVCVRNPAAHKKKIHAPLHQTTLHNEAAAVQEEGLQKANCKKTDLPHKEPGTFKRTDPHGTGRHIIKATTPTARIAASLQQRSLQTPLTFLGPAGAPMLVCGKEL